MKTVEQIMFDIRKNTIKNLKTGVYSEEGIKEGIMTHTFWVLRFFGT